MNVGMIPLLEIREKVQVKGEEKEIPSLVISWINVSKDFGEVALGLNVERFGSLNCLKRLLTNIIELMTLGGKVDDKIEDLGSAISMLNYIAESPHYPFTYVTMGFHEGFEEQAQSYVISTIHRMSKKPFSIVPYKYLEESLTKPCIIVDKKMCTECVRYFLAIALASFLTAKTRRGYTMALVLAQTLPLFVKIIDTEVLTKVIASVASYIYTLIGKRIVGEMGETMRHLVPKPITVNREFSELYEELWKALNYEMSRNVPLLEKVMSISAKLQEMLRVRNEVIFGRIVELVRNLQNLQTKTGSRKVDVVVTIATEQWSPLQRHVLEEVLNDHGELLVLYTQASIHNIITEKTISSQISICRHKHKLPGKPMRLRYVLVSSTDAYIAENVGRIVENELRRDREKHGDVLVLAQGPASLSIPLYLWAKNKGFTAIMI